MTLRPPRPEDTRKAQERLQAIYGRVRASFAENLATIDAAVNHLRSGALAEPERSAAERAAHRLAGAAGMIGFPEATEPAQQLEAAFTDDHLDPDTARHLAAEVATLRRVLSGSQVPATDLPERLGPRPT